MYGGSLEFALVINSTLYTKMTSMQVQEQTSIAFSLLSVKFSFNHGKNVSTKDVSRDFRQNTQVVLFAYGGNSLLLQEGNYSKWAASVPSNPAPINASYREITDLFSDDDNSASARRACMQAEVKAYLSRKSPPRYRCGDAAGTKVLSGIPRPGSAGRGRVLSLGSLPTLRDSKFTPAARYRVSCRNRERCEDGDAANEQLFPLVCTECWHRWLCDLSKVIRELLQQISLGKLSILRQESRVFLLHL